jgi:hypothetical protein
MSPLGQKRRGVLVCFRTRAGAVLAGQHAASRFLSLAKPETVPAEAAVARRRRWRGPTVPWIVDGRGLTSTFPRPKEPIFRGFWGLQS